MKKKSHGNLNLFLGVNFVDLAIAIYLEGHKWISISNYPEK